MELNKDNTYLLYGITGSGKTVVYIDLITKVINSNKTAIMLVPEISLTTQMVNRLYSSFGDDVAILHSGLSDGEKYDEYTKINNGEVKANIIAIILILAIVIALAIIFRNQLTSLFNRIWSSLFSNVDNVLT